MRWGGLRRGGYVLQKEEISDVIFLVYIRTFFSERSTGIGDSSTAGSECWSLFWMPLFEQNTVPPEACPISTCSPHQREHWLAGFPGKPARHDGQEPESHSQLIPGLHFAQIDRWRGWCVHSRAHSPLPPGTAGLRPAHSVGPCSRPLGPASRTVAVQSVPAPKHATPHIQRVKNDALIEMQ